MARPLRHGVHGGRLRDRPRRRQAARAGRRRRRQPLGDDRPVARRRALLPLARAGKLERDVWLVHLTGEEFPADCLGARALCPGAGRAAPPLHRRGRERCVDVSRVRVTRRVRARHGRATTASATATSSRSRRAKGAASARLAPAGASGQRALEPPAESWNQAPERRGKGRAQRMQHGAKIPPLVRAPAPARRGPSRSGIRARRCTTPTARSSRTSGSRWCCSWRTTTSAGPATTTPLDTMANIDLDYAAALIAIAIETVAATACAP